MKRTETSHAMQWMTNCLTMFIAFALITIGVPQAEACTRVLYETGTGTYIVGPQHGLERPDHGDRLLGLPPWHEAQTAASGQARSPGPQSTAR